MSYSQLIDIRKAEPEKRMEQPAPVVKLPVEPGAVEVAFTDGGNLKMLLRDDKIALATAHGKLIIAVADVQRIVFATRVSEVDSKRISAAVADLGNTNFRKREAAGVELLKLREKAYPALLRAAEQKDPEVARRARDLLQKLTAVIPAENLEIRKRDVVWTADSMIAGRIETASMKAHTTQFGEVQVKLADVRALHSQGIDPRQFDLMARDSSMGYTRRAVTTMKASRPWKFRAQEKK